MGSASLAAAGDLMSAFGTKSADNMRAAQLEQSAQYGRMAAEETNANLLDRLNITLGNIDAVRAAGHTDPTSPTSVAIRDRTAELGNEDRAIRIGNIMGQVSQDEASANYMRSAGQYAILQGIVGANADIAKSVGQTNWASFGYG